MTSSSLKPQASSLGFTTIELLVSMALMMIAMVGVVGIFNISSTTAARTAAHAEVVEASAALQAELANQLAHVTPGLFIIESPAPTLVRSEIPGGPKFLRLRHDRLVFISSQDLGSFQSYTDPQRGIPGTFASEHLEPATSLNALLYFGPGIPVGSDGVPQPFEGTGASLPAVQWRFLERAILLLTQPVQAGDGWAAPNTPPNITDDFNNPGGMLNGGPLVDVLLKSRVDAVAPKTSADANPASAILEAVQAMLASNMTGRDFDPTTGAPMASPAQIHSLWQPSWSPITARIDLPPTSPPADPYPPDYYARSGAMFLPRLADFRIEWTDGRRIDPLGPDDTANTGDEDFRTRWFGLVPDPAGQPDPYNPASIDAMKYQARMRAIADISNPSNPNDGVPGNPGSYNPDNPAAETAAFANIEWSPTGVVPDADAAYRAVWRTDTWQYRPKALRFTYRLYDAGNRLVQRTNVDLNENGIADPDDTNVPRTIPPAIVTRFGQEFSIVVQVP